MTKILRRQSCKCQIFERDKKKKKAKTGRMPDFSILSLIPNYISFTSVGLSVSPGT